MRLKHIYLWLCLNHRTTAWTFSLSFLIKTIITVFFTGLLNHFLFHLVFTWNHSPHSNPHPRSPWKNQIFPDLSSNAASMLSGIPLQWRDASAGYPLSRCPSLILHTYPDLKKKSSPRIMDTASKLVWQASGWESNMSGFKIYVSLNWGNKMQQQDFYDS